MSRPWATPGGTPAWSTIPGYQCLPTSCFWREGIPAPLLSVAGSAPHPRRVQVNCKAANFVVLGILGTVLSFGVPIATGQAQQPRRTETAPAGNIENGKKRFQAHSCVSCHSFSGQGGAGARLAHRIAQPTGGPADRHGRLLVTHSLP